MLLFRVEHVGGNVTDEMNLNDKNIGFTAAPNHRSDYFSIKYHTEQQNLTAL